MANVPKISLPAEPIFEIVGLPITNSHLAALLLSIFLLIIAALIRRRLSLVPTRGQVIIEGLISFFLVHLKTAYGTEERARRHLPYIVTLFLFIALFNEFSLLPFLGAIITGEGTSLFRTPTSHYSLPIALALITVVGANLVAFAVSPLRYIGKFIKITPLVKARSFSQLGNALLEIFIGILDIVSELAKIISMSSRLFGNIFAGEVMYITIISLSMYTQFILPFPFIFLGFFSAIIQALVFSLLALNFMAGTLPAPKEKTA